MDCRVASDIDERFEQAWRAHLPMLSRRARRLSGGHPDRADELLAATALKAFQFTRHRPQFMEQPKGFLFVVLRHVFVDGLRRSVREGQVFDDTVDVDALTATPEHSSAPSAMHRLEVQQQIACVEAVLRRMTPAQRRLFAFRFIEDLPYPQIAERLGINQPLLRKRVQLIRDRLRAEMDNGGLPLGKPCVSLFTERHALRYEKNSAARRDRQTSSTKGNDHG
ncbi:sigma-70 family RNA polymerase sigma factor [Dyella sp. ASV21]|jgi:RNA polymerase sigma-70 factor (ECF subfamily)|uniref:RNA polymerase sigma factor n=1 Tax=Dyella sp. ASV21 TaxID=2795114 RepID=UPI002103E5FB|nr:sigma-70 family RNA polymerase sigma factor [Dyella sp. ASV21]